MNQVKVSWTRWRYPEPVKGAMNQSLYKHEGIMNQVKGSRTSHSLNTKRLWTSCRHHDPVEGMMNQLKGAWTSHSTDTNNVTMNQFEGSWTSWRNKWTRWREHEPVEGITNQSLYRQTQRDHEPVNLKVTLSGFIKLGIGSDIMTSWSKLELLLKIFLFKWQR